MPCVVFNDKDDRDRGVERFDVQICEILRDIKAELILADSQRFAGEKIAHPPVAIRDPLSDRFTVFFKRDANAGGWLAAAQIENVRREAHDDTAARSWFGVHSLTNSTSS